MNNLNELAKEYKQTKSQVILNNIFKLLYKALKDKASYVFYKQNFFKEKRTTEIFNRKTKRFEKKEEIITIKLYNTKKIELEDIEQELKLKVMELLTNFDVKKPFENYLFSTLKNWRPSYVQEVNFMKGLDTINESDLNNKDEENINLDNFPAPEQKIEEPTNYEILFQNLTIQERFLINILRRCPNKKQQELADIIGVTHQRIDQILKVLRKKVK